MRYVAYIVIILVMAGCVTPAKRRTFVTNFHKKSFDFPNVSDSNVFIFNKITFPEFISKEIDSVKIVSYIKNENFLHPIDSFFASPYKYKGNPNIETPILNLNYWALPCSRDYEIILKDKKSYKISDIVVKIHKNNKLCSGIKEMYSYVINGKIEYSSQIELIKNGHECQTSRGEYKYLKKLTKRRQHMDKLLKKKITEW